MPSNFHAVGRTKREYIIPFVGLKIGVHEFEFDITDAFFEEFEYSIVKSGDVKVHLQLDKKETMLVGQFQLEGSVNTECDRCGDPVKIDIDGEYQLIFKFDTEPSDDETLVVLYPEDFEIDLNDHILELINVSLPARSVHESEEDCNEEMMDLLDEYTNFSDDDEGYDDEDDDEDEDDVDPRWAALKGLK